MSVLFAPVILGGPLLAALQVWVAFRVWRHALRNLSPRVDRRPLALGMWMFTAGWLVAALGSAGAYPWSASAGYGNSGLGVLIFLFGSPVAYGILLLVGVPGTIVLLRLRLLGYGSGLALVAVAILGSALIVWSFSTANQWEATHRWESFLGDLQAAAEIMLPPATLGVLGLVFAVRRQQRAGGASSVPPRPVLRGTPAGVALLRAGEGATLAILTVALFYSIARNGPLMPPAHGVQASIVGPPITVVRATPPRGLVAVHVEPLEARALRTMIAEFSRAAGYEVRDYSGDRIAPDLPLVAVEIARGAMTVAVVVGGRELGALPVEVHGLTDGADDRLFGRALAAAMAERWPTP